MDYTSYMNEIGSARKPSPLRSQHAKFLSNAETSQNVPIYLSGGMPNGQTFPIIRGSFELRDGTHLELDQKMTATAMQYDSTEGNKELLDWLYELQRQVHKPPTYKNANHPGQMGLLIVNGSQHGLCTVFESLISKGDIIMVESPTYAGAVAAVKPLKPDVITIATDEHGIIPESLEQKLSRWDHATIQQPGKDGPKLLYTVPTNGNPTGTILKEDRKKKIYELARKYKFLIVEDDPYYYLKKRPYEPSFLSMDTDGRVIRIDSISKIISAGLRLGMVSAPMDLIEVLKKAMEVSIQGTSGLSQIFLLALLNKWGYQGFYDNAEKVASFYEKRKEESQALAKKYLTDVAEWNNPDGGMFLWIKLKVPDADPVVIELINERGIFVAPGSVFSMEKDPVSPYIRVSYSNCKMEDLEKAFIAIREVVQQSKAKTEE